VIVFMKPQRKDELCENKIADALGDGYSVKVIDCAVSTNSELWKAAVNGEKEGTLIIAKRQTGGKGRLGRSFCSEEGGLYMSLLLKPELSPEDTALITPLAALAVSEAIEELLGVDTAIKWVNDVYCKSKKVCGILTEASIDPVVSKTNFAVVGVGINVYEPYGGFPEEIKDIAGALLPSDADEDGIINRLAANIAHRIFEYAKASFNPRALDEYRRRCFVIGKDIEVHRGGEHYGAKALGIDERFALIIEDENGVRKALSSGEISVRIKDGGE